MQNTSIGKSVAAETARRDDIKVSVLCRVYNQARYVRRALDGILSQRTDFAFEVIVHDDASTDGSADIVREYASLHPDVVIPVLQTENQYSKGIWGFKYMWPLMRGKYVALCDADDWWTDPMKLQMQSDWLDAHPDSGICFCYSRCRWEDGSHPDSVIPSERLAKENLFSFRFLLTKWNFIPSNTVMYRWRLYGRQDSFPFGIQPEDWYLNLLHAETGEIGFIPKVMSVYWRNPGSLWYGHECGSDRFYERNAIRILEFHKEIERRFGCRNELDLPHTMSSAIRSAVRTRDFDLLRKLSECSPQVYAVCADGLFSRKEVKRAKDRLRAVKRRCRFLYALLAVSVLLTSLLFALCFA